MADAPRETATLGGGCFWCLDAVYRRLRGVERVVSGYAGGRRPDPTYEQVCSGATGHAEVVQITYDPSVVSYRDLLDVFFTIHDPTTPDRQGADVGTQYRSVIFPHSDAQLAEAEQAIAGLERDRVWGAPVVTRIEPYTGFHPAEPEHQDYYANHASRPYCRVVIEPKLAALRREHLERLRR